MKMTFAQYEHSTIGFPRVKLKFCFDDANGYFGSYVTRNEVIIEDWVWTEDNPHKVTERWLEHELEAFDKHTRFRYCDDPTVQG